MVSLIQRVEHFLEWWEPPVFCECGEQMRESSWSPLQMECPKCDVDHGDPKVRRRDDAELRMMEE